MISIKLNGKDKVIDKNKTVLDIIQDCKLDSTCIIAELNKEILEQPELAKIKLNQNDILELINFVGGG